MVAVFIQRCAISTSQPVVNTNHGMGRWLNGRLLFSSHRNPLLNIQRIIFISNWRWKGSNGCTSETLITSWQGRGLCRKGTSWTFSWTPRVEAAAQWVLPLRLAEGCWPWEWDVLSNFRPGGTLLSWPPPLWSQSRPLPDLTRPTALRGKMLFSAIYR